MRFFSLLAVSFIYLSIPALGEEASPGTSETKTASEAQSGDSYHPTSPIYFTYPRYPYYGWGCGWKNPEVVAKYYQTHQNYRNPYWGFWGYWSWRGYVIIHQPETKTSSGEFIPAFSVRSWYPIF